ncbi:alpha/beta-hydrolase, partial [Athelia psychrophila]
PDAPAEYVPSKIVRDIVDILDAEGVEKVVSIGHDWGTMINSRLGNYFPERVIALAFFNLGYLPPFFTADFAALSTATKAAVGYECFGYWPFFNEDDADKLIEEHLDSFLSVGFSNDPTLLQSDFAPVGALKAWLVAGKMATFGAYITDEERRVQKDFFVKGGLKGPLNWYKAAMRGFTAEDDKLIPQDRYAISQPVFFGGCKQDFVCRPELAKPALDAYAKKLTYREFDGDHWTLISHPKDVNRELLSWIETVLFKVCSLFTTHFNSHTCRAFLSMTGPCQCDVARNEAACDPDLTGTSKFERSRSFPVRRQPGMDKSSCQQNPEHWLPEYFGPGTRTDAAGVHCSGVSASETTVESVTVVLNMAQGSHRTQCCLVCCTIRTALVTKPLLLLADRKRMDSALYKDLTVSRGINYHYYFSPARDSNPTILFLHGFPSTSYDWRHEAAFFTARGFGVIVPDLLGYGGTAKPDAPA